MFKALCRYSSLITLPRAHQSYRKGKWTHKKIVFTVGCQRCDADHDAGGRDQWVCLFCPGELAWVSRTGNTAIEKEREHFSDCVGEKVGKLWCYSVAMEFMDLLSVDVLALTKSLARKCDLRYWKNNLLTQQRLGWMGKYQGLIGSDYGSVPSNR